MRYLLLTLFVFCSLQGQNPNDWAKFFKLCYNIEKNEEAFKNFRRHPLVTELIDVVSQEQGERFCDYILKNYPYLLKYDQIFHLSDQVGNPIVYPYKKLGSCCPTTLRSIKVAGDLKKEFGDLRDQHIVEIGAGYGSLCKILWDIGGFASYTIIDRRPYLILAKKYLEKLKVRNVQFIDYDEILVSESFAPFDLVINLYSLSDALRGEQKQYLEKVIKSASKGYMIYRPVARETEVGPFTLKAFLNQMRRFGKFPKMQTECPLTSPNNKQILWK